MNVWYLVENDGIGVGTPSLIAIERDLLVLSLLLAKL